MKKLATLSPGSIFNFAGERFVVMEQRDGAAYASRQPSGEEMHEMRSAFGAGTTVVDVLSGRRYAV